MKFFKGSEIAKNCIVGSYSVVTKNILDEIALLLERQQKSLRTILIGIEECQLSCYKLRELLIRLISNSSVCNCLKVLSKKFLNDSSKYEVKNFSSHGVA